MLNAHTPQRTQITNNAISLIAEAKLPAIKLFITRC
jgi:hypothetical protein